MKPKEDIFKCDLHKKLIHKSTIRQTTPPPDTHWHVCVSGGKKC